MPQFYVEELVQELGSSRIMLGTGMPLSYPEGVLSMVQDAELPDDARNMILSANALDLLDVEIQPVEQGS
jgi:predicted TIM-barrel fold metal-dependent hydrolase